MAGALAIVLAIIVGMFTHVWSWSVNPFPMATGCTGSGVLTWAEWDLPYSWNLWTVPKYDIMWVEFTVVTTLTLVLYFLRRRLTWFRFNPLVIFLVVSNFGPYLFLPAIIALLIAILLPSLQAAREQARAAACLSNLHSIGQGIVWAGIVHYPTVDHQLTSLGIGANNATDNFAESRFAGAILTDQAVNGAGRDGQVDIGQRRDAAKMLTDTADLNVGM